MKQFKQGHHVMICRTLYQDRPEDDLIPAVIEHDKMVDEYYAVVTEDGKHKLRKPSEIFEKRE